MTTLTLTDLHYFAYNFHKKFINFNNDKKLTIGIRFSGPSDNQSTAVQMFIYYLNSIDSSITKIACVYSVISLFISQILLSLGTIYAAKGMHDILLNHVLRWPMLQFDSTPQGRVLNRFSADVNTIDNLLPMNLRSCLLTFFGVNT